MMIYDRLQIHVNGAVPIVSFRVRGGASSDNDANSMLNRIW